MHQQTTNVDNLYNKNFDDESVVAP